MCSLCFYEREGTCVFTVYQIAFFRMHEKVLVHNFNNTSPAPGSPSAVRFIVPHLSTKDHRRLLGIYHVTIINRACIYSG